jgi:tetratricopeptide (TPR) repeat protein
VRGFNQAIGRLLGAAALFVYGATAQTDDLASESHKAKELMAQGRYEEAIPIYESLVKALPGNPGLVLNLGLAEEMAGHPAEAVPHFEAVLKVQPESVPALTSLAMARLQLHQPGRAIPPLEKLLRLRPDDVAARGMLAGAQMSQDQFGEAAEQYQKLTKTDPSDPKGWYGLGKAYESLAGRYFDKLSKAAPESPYVAVLIADSRVQRQQYRSAFFFYHQAEAKLPDLLGLHAGLARVYHKTGHDDWAAAEEQKEQERPAKTCTPQTAECEFLKGNFLDASKVGASGTTPDALFWATKAYNQLALKAFDHLGSLPDSVEIHALKAQILRDHGQDLEAANEWRVALKLNPGDLRLEHELVKALFLGKDYRSAIPLAEKLLSQEPGSPDLNFIIGDSLRQTQQPEKAIPYLESALRGQPDMLAADAALGMSLALLDRSTEAVPHLQRALTLDNDGSLHYNLARAYRAAGNADGARQAMEGYQQIKARNQQVDSELAKEAEITAPAK